MRSETEQALLNIVGFDAERFANRYDRFMVYVETTIEIIKLRTQLGKDTILDFIDIDFVFQVHKVRLEIDHQWIVVFVFITAEVDVIVTFVILLQLLTEMVRRFIQPACNVGMVHQLFILNEKFDEHLLRAVFCIHIVERVSQQNKLKDRIFVLVPDSSYQEINNLLSGKMYASFKRKIFRYPCTPLL